MTQTELPRTVWLSDLDMTLAISGIYDVKRNLSANGNPLSIAGRKFERGLGVRVDSFIHLKLGGRATRFDALVGIDDDMAGAQPVGRFRVVGDGKVLHDTGPVKTGEGPHKISVDLSGVDVLLLHMMPKDDQWGCCHGDWAEASVEIHGDDPVVIRRPVEKIRLTPAIPAAPRFNSPSVHGARVGSPVLFRLPVSGERSMRFSARDLPEGLSLDADKGIISGRTMKAGTFAVDVTATNRHGEASGNFILEIGSRLALTPPMGWNSWNCWRHKTTQDLVLRGARAMVNTGLADHGWQYINIDDMWQSDRRGGFHNGIVPNENFPDMMGMCDEIHSLGLKAGIYSTPWGTTYGGKIGSYSNHPEGRHDGTGHCKYSFVKNDVEDWSDWGFDYLKYDWNPIDISHVREMSEALRDCGRDIVFSLSNGASFNLLQDYVKYANCWRTTGDVIDTWSSVAQTGFALDAWAPWAGPGHWNDADMMVLGWVSWGDPEIRDWRLTPDEQYTHMSLWCLLSSPLLLGNDLERLDDFTLGLLTNDEIIAVNQDPLGLQARLVFRDSGGGEVWAKPMADGSYAVGLFNRSEETRKVNVRRYALKLEGQWKIRDLWRQQDVGNFDEAYTAEIPSHGVVMLGLRKV